MFNSLHIAGLTLKPASLTFAGARLFEAIDRDDKPVAVIEPRSFGLNWCLILEQLQLAGISAVPRKTSTGRVVLTATATANAAAADSSDELVMRVFSALQTKRSVTGKALPRHRFFADLGWMLETGETAPARAIQVPQRKLRILYSKRAKLSISLLSLACLAAAFIFIENPNMMKSSQRIEGITPSQSSTSAPTSWQNAKQEPSAKLRGKVSLSGVETSLAQQATKIKAASFDADLALDRFAQQNLTAEVADVVVIGGAAQLTFRLVETNQSFCARFETIADQWHLVWVKPA